jgi:hypothetical protein
MKISHMILAVILIEVLSVGPAPAQQKVRLGENAALRYWSAFAQLQDYAITDDEAKEMNGILDGPVPYVDSKYKELIEKNRPALDTMARGTALANCDWGVDYQLGDDAPVDYIRKALALARLNVLYAFHLQITGDKEGALRTLETGLRFSRDVANGGSLFAALAAKDSLIEHLRAITFVQHVDGLSAQQRSALQKAFAQLGSEPLDWQSAMKREMDLLNRPPAQASVPLEAVTEAYLSALNDPSRLPKLQQMIVSVPQPLRDVIPDPKKVLEEKHELSERIQQTRSLLAVTAK